MRPKEVQDQLDLMNKDAVETKKRSKQFFCYTLFRFFKTKD